MGANFTPNLIGLMPLMPLKFWCQKVLPLVYDDSLSYMELLCKITNYLNNTITDVKILEDFTTQMVEAYRRLEAYVDANIGGSAGIEYPFLTPQMFGAIGDGVTDDKQALIDWMNGCIQQNKIGILPTGTYIWTSTQTENAETDWDVYIPNEKNLIIIGMGENSVIKRKSNCLPSGIKTHQYAMMSIKAKKYDFNTSCNVVIKNITLDGNYREQYDFIDGGTSGESCASLRVSGQYTSNTNVYNKINAYFHDVKSVDPVGDGISTGGSIMHNSVDNFVFYNFTGIRTRYIYGRGDISVIAYPNNLKIYNSTMETIQFESGGGTTRGNMNVTIDNTTIKNLADLLAPSGYNMFVNITNSKFYNHFLAVKATGKIDNCEFYTNDSAEKIEIACPTDLTITNSKFEAVNNRFYVIGSYGNLNSNYDSKITIDNCLFDVKNYASTIEIRQSKTTLISAIRNCRIINDGIAESSVCIENAHFNNLILESNTYEGAVHAIYLRAVSGYSSTVYLQGNNTLVGDTYLVLNGSGSWTVNMSGTLRGKKPWNYQGGTGASYFTNTAWNGYMEIYPTEFFNTEDAETYGFIRNTVVKPFVSDSSQYANYFIQTSFRATLDAMQASQNVIKK